jgi:chromosome segregation ATPase
MSEIKALEQKFEQLSRQVQQRVETRRNRLANENRSLKRGGVAVNRKLKALMESNKQIGQRYGNSKKLIGKLLKEARALKAREGMLRKRLGASQALLNEALTRLKKNHKAMMDAYIRKLAFTTKNPSATYRLLKEAKNKVHADKIFGELRRAIGAPAPRAGRRTVDTSSARRVTESRDPGVEFTKKLVHKIEG